MLLRVAGPQHQDVLLADIAGGGNDPVSDSDKLTPITDAVRTPLDEFLPSIGTGAPSDSFIETVIGSIEEPVSGYQNQNR
jgi:hypothetical protein